MKRVLIACLAAAFLSATASAKIKTINLDNGGELTVYWNRAEAIGASGGSIRFNGPCRSACTLYLRLPPKRLCATQAASFWFHAPWGGKNATEDLSNKMALMSAYPPWVVSWIYTETKGVGLTDKWLFMGSWVAIKHIGKCP